MSQDFHVCDEIHSKYSSLYSERIENRHSAILSLCVSAVVLTLGGDDIVEVDAQVRDQVHSEREKEDVRDKEKGNKTRTNNARSNM